MENLEAKIKELESKILNQATEETEDTGLSTDRIGNFTGSGLKKLMTCASRKKGLDWTMIEKLVDFGDTALNYCLEKACERNTGKMIETPTTWEMKWGTEHEPIARKKLEEKFKVEVPEQDFMFFANNAGTTPDGFINAIEYGIGVATNVNVEIKCPPKFMNHAKYLSEPVTETHEYFWQIQAEMLSQKMNRDNPCEKTLFVSYHPAFKGESQLGCQFVEYSKIHQFAIFFRCLIGERIINKILDDNFSKMPNEYLQEVLKDVPRKNPEFGEWFQNLK